MLCIRNHNIPVKHLRSVYSTSLNAIYLMREQTFKRLLTKNHDRMFMEEVCHFLIRLPNQRKLIGIPLRETFKSSYIL